jgi:hypothetical protein
LFILFCTKPFCHLYFFYCINFSCSTILIMWYFCF